jgi:CRP-like cAMP-binding protein
MKNTVDVYNVVKSNPLWSGIGLKGFESIILCMDGRTRKFKKSAVILMSGDEATHIGMVLSGGVRVIGESIDGNSTILTELSESDIFGEVFACAGIDHIPVSIIAARPCEILFINYKKIATSCSSACDFHRKLIENMLKLIARKSLELNQKIEILSKRTTRAKLRAFFDEQRGLAKKFTVSLNREEMARYLCVDRSAMSNELGKMRDEGLIRFNKNAFELLD